MLISSLLENTSNSITLDEVTDILNNSNLLFENDILIAENRLMETQINALNEMLDKGLTLSENVSNLEVIQENALTDFLKNIKNMIINLCKKIKSVIKSIFKSDKKITSDPTYTKLSKIKTSGKGDDDKYDFTLDVFDGIKLKNIINVNSGVIDRTNTSVDTNIKRILQSGDNISDRLKSLRTETIDDFLKNIIGGYDIKLNTDDITKYIKSKTFIKVDVSLDNAMDVYGRRAFAGDAYTAIEDTIESITKLVESDLLKDVDKLMNDKVLSDIKNELTKHKISEEIIIKLKADIITDYVKVLNMVNSVIIKLFKTNQSHIKKLMTEFNDNHYRETFGQEALDKKKEHSNKSQKEFKERLEKNGERQMEQIKKQIKFS